MKILSLLCNHCGAPLEVKEGTRFCTCSYCNSKLQVQDTGTAVYSEVLESIENRTKKIEQDVATIKLQNDLGRIDREWLEVQKRYQIKGKDGHMSIPDKKSAQLIAVGGVIAGVVWMAIAFSITSGFGGMGMGLFGSIFPLFGLVFAGIAVYMSKSIGQKAEKYEAAREAYQQERRTLLRQIKERG